MLKFNLGFNVVSVDSIMQGFKDKVEQLEMLKAAKEVEATAIDAQIYDMQNRKLAAGQEITRADKIMTKLRDILQG